MAKSKVTSKFQVTVPLDARRLLELQAGDHVIFEITPEKLVTIRKAMPTHFSSSKVPQSSQPT